MAFGALGGGDWWDKHRLGYGVVATVASLQHWASRLKMVASVAKCLLGERSLQFFRFRGPRCVGQRDLYPFAIFFRELPVDRHEELIRRAMRWPDPLADQKHFARGAPKSFGLGVDQRCGRKRHSGIAIADLGQLSPESAECCNHGDQ
jgi:hypothetical protein